MFKLVFGPGSCEERRSSSKRTAENETEQTQANRPNASAVRGRLTASVTMKGTMKNKQVVTSGRLTGRVKVPPVRKRVPGAAAGPEPAFSLYSTDSEDQVTSLHKGLDRCAALLGGILQAEKAEALPSRTRAVKEGEVKSKPSTSVAKRTVKRIPAQTAPDQSRCPSVLRGSGSRTPGVKHQAVVAAAHSGVKLRPPQRRAHAALQPRLSPPQHRLPSTPPSQPSTPSLQPQACTPPDPGGRRPLQADRQPASEALHTHSGAGCGGEEEDFVPVRDMEAHSTAAHTHTAVRHTQLSHTHTCTSLMTHMQLQPADVDRVLQDAPSREDGSAETHEKEETVQLLLGELKALIAGRGSVAEKLLSRLEQTVFSLQTTAGGSNIQTEGDRTSLHRHAAVLHQHLSETEEAKRQHHLETLCDSQVSSLQQQLVSAQSRLQELQDDVSDLQKALQDTQKQLRERDRENTVIRTDLEATRSRFLNSEREKIELTVVAQQRLEEIEHLKRTVQSRSSSDCPTLVNSSTSETLPTKLFESHQHRQDPAAPPTDRITQYLMSLGQLEPAAAEREADTQNQRPTSVQLKDSWSHPDVRPQRGDEPSETSETSETSACRQKSHLDRSHRSDGVKSCRQQLESERGRLPDSTLSHCDVESVWSEWSSRSGSTFNTRDEAAFRDGLSALDASIASLQKTIQLDLRR